MNLAHVLSPLFLCILAGIAFGKWRRIGPEPFVSAVMDLFMPALVFDALLTANVSLSEMLASGVSSVIVIAFLYMICLSTQVILGKENWPVRRFALPVLFMNAGFLGMPLMSLTFGPEAVGRIVVYDQVQSLFMFTLGIWIAAPRASHQSLIRKSMASFLKEPLVYAILAGIGFRWAGVSIPESVLMPVRFLGSATSPLALFALGLRLSSTPLKFLADPVMQKSLGVILLLRFVGGWGCGIAAVEILSLDGLSRQVVLIASALPSAVFSYILAERYQAEPDLAAAAVFTTTILFLPLLPIFLRLAA